MADSTSEVTQQGTLHEDSSSMECGSQDDNNLITQEISNQEETNAESSDLITTSIADDKDNKDSTIESTTRNTEIPTSDEDKNTSGDCNESRTSGDCNEPRTSGDCNEPRSSGDCNEPRSSGDCNEPRTSGDCNEPRTSGDCNEPRTSSVDCNEPRTSGDCNEPVTDPYHYTKGEEFTSEVFKIEIRNLPRYFGFSQLKKQLNKLKLNPKKLKAMKGNHGNFGFVTFTCEEDKQKALKVLDGYTWKKSKLVAVSAKPVADPVARNAMKRKQEERRSNGSGHRSDGNKKRKQEEPIGTVTERLNDAVTPLWRKSYEDQLKMKDANMKEFIKLLTRRTKEQIGTGMLRVMNPAYLKNIKDDMCCSLEPIKPSPVLNGYRNKCEFTVGTSPDGIEKTVGFRLGTYKGGQISVVDPSECLHLSEPTKNVVKCFQTYIRQVSKLGAFDPVTHNGHWRMLTVRTNTHGDIMAIVVLHPHQLTKDEIEIEKKQLQDFFQSGDDGKEAAVSTMFILLQSSTSREDDSSQQCELIYGVPHITEDIIGLSFRVSPEAFFQVNSKAAEVLYSTVADFAQVNENSTVLDICCGTGTIGISLAKRVDQVIGIEVNQQAIQDAIYNAQQNGLTNVSYKCGKAEDVMPNITNNLKSSKDVIGIVDPPRAGIAFKVLQAIRRCENLRRLVYVSCNPHNAINNFIDLCRPPSNRHKGTPFWPVKAVSVDLFPHTKHCELVILFERELKEVGTISKEASVKSADQKDMESNAKADEEVTQAIKKEIEEDLDKTERGEEGANVIEEGLNIKMEESN